MPTCERAVWFLSAAVAEAVRVLKMLESSSTPAAKKRMLMKSTFGDYRKKMADELRQIDASQLRILSFFQILILFKWLRERTEHLNVFLFSRPSLNGVLFPMFCLLVEGECQILVF